MKDLFDNPESEICRRNEDRSITVFRHEPADLEAVARILFSIQDENALLRKELELFVENEMLMEYVFSKLLNRDQVVEMMRKDES